jgi:hypothetical protein
MSEEDDAQNTVAETINLMNEAKLKSLLGAVLVVSHIGLIFLIVALFAAHGFAFDEMTTLLSIIAPMFAAYTTAVVRYFISHRHRKVTLGQTSREAVIIVLLFPTLFGLALATLVVLKAFNLAFENFEQLKVLIAAMEGIFAAYIAFIVTEFFERKPRNADEKKKAQSVSL